MKAQRKLPKVHLLKPAATLTSALLLLCLAGAAASAQMSAPVPADHLNRATLSPSGAIASESGRWLNGVDHSSAGNYTLTFNPIAFSGPPTCVATALAADGIANVIAPTLSCSPATASSLTCQARAGVNAVDSGLSILCVGP